MSEQRNIVILGASVSGLPTAHYILKFILPALKATHGAKYHVYLINPSTNWYFRVAAPRVATCIQRLPLEKAIYDITEGFKQYAASDFTFVVGSTVDLIHSDRTVVYRRSGASQEERLPYHALVMATGSRTPDPVFSMHTDSAALTEAIKARNKKVQSAREIIIVGGGPTGVESAGEIGELRNGLPGWFGSSSRNANITLITSAKQLVPQLRPALDALAETKLRSLGVDVVYNSRVVDVSEGKNGRMTVTLADGKKMDTDLYIPALGVEPNSSFVSVTLLTDQSYVKTNPQTLRVDAAGPKVYAVGDVASYSRNCYLDIYGSLPTLFVNLKRDLLSYPNEKPRGKDRLFTPNMKENGCVPIGSKGGVGAIMGWRMANWMVWLLKARDYMTSMGQDAHARGDKVKEVKWTQEEAAI